MPYVTWINGSTSCLTSERGGGVLTPPLVSDGLRCDVGADLIHVERPDVADQLIERPGG
jgi:hypothetical protein